ncbi:MAG: hypothetical protein WD034_10955 [Parvibaculum sp.]|uniref:hypothetical protein n=1 Tax=Parvibaculum sp. TaxID=2024848 RepID=UPI0034A01BEC
MSIAASLVRPLPEPRLDNLTGLWRRSLILWPDGRRDDTSWVNWLQGPGLYLDLRQPAGRPDFAHVASLADLTPRDMGWLARQEGFAGELVHEGGWFEWRRDIDFQPEAIYSDRGRLRVEGDVMIEEGADIPYIEHWHREPIAAEPCWAMRLRDRDGGRKAALIRLGHLFMYARDRVAMPPPHLHLRDCVARAATLDEARALVDCEISQGIVTSAGWIVQRSSLPFREGKTLAPVFGGATLATADTDADGRVMARHWEVIDLRGTPVFECRGE